MPSPVSPPSRPVASSKAMIRKKGGGLVKNKRTNMEGAHKFGTGGGGERGRERQGRGLPFLAVKAAVEFNLPKK